MPAIFCTAGIAGPGIYSSNMRIPIDDESLMFYRLRWSYDPIPEKEIVSYKHGEYVYPRLIPGTFTPAMTLRNLSITNSELVSLVSPRMRAMVVRS